MAANRQMRFARACLQAAWELVVLLALRRFHPVSSISISTGHVLIVSTQPGSMDIIKILLDHQADPFLAPPSQRLQQDAVSNFLCFWCCYLTEVL